MRHLDPDRPFSAVWSDPLSRRELLRTAGAGVGLLAIAGVAGACTSSAPPSESGDGSSQGGAGGGEFAGALSHVFGALDPITQTWFGTVVVTDFIHEVLYRIDPFPPRENVTPELATELPRQLDETTYRVPLRQGVTFHDGTPLTADDVVFTIGRIKDPATASLFMGFFEIVAEARSVGDHEVELSLTSPTTLLAPLLSLAKIQSRSAVEASAEALELKPIGTGPYRVDTAVSGNAVTLRRFDQYSGPRSFAFDEVALDVVADANARTAGLRSSQWQAIEQVQAGSLDSLAGTDGLEAESVTSYHQVDLLFNCGKPPFDDPRVRRAALYAIDRDTITATSYFGQATPAWGGHLSPDHPSYTEPRTVYRFDSAYARSLLAEAGYGNEPLDIVMLAATNIEEINSQTPLVEQNLIDAGFRPDIVSGEQESLYSRVSEGSFDVYLASRDASALGVTDAVLLLRLMYTGSFPRTLLFWDGEPLQRLEELSGRALAAPDPASRDSLVAEMTDLLAEEVPLAPLHFKKQITAWSSQLSDFRPLPTVGLALDGVNA
ncbi:ABC transporter substrate-binding protein [Jiangella asiatica]|uniref:ABC transporter substrate-binding protein n=1 Tax=Jiangella asiatica TaxID=2530372 RepID=A0A4V2Z3Q6_9ACTN|nr:ABC transporter substrate-binding protein [Jiangella asiatica]TDE13528.1 ABC transporter substrate-binding protein [Jiangella asiatica]